MEAVPSSHAGADHVTKRLGSDRAPTGADKSKYAAASPVWNDWDTALLNSLVLSGYNEHTETNWQNVSLKLSKLCGTVRTTTEVFKHFCMRKPEKLWANISTKSLGDIANSYIEQSHLLSQQTSGPGPSAIVPAPGPNLAARDARFPHGAASRANPAKRKYSVLSTALSDTDSDLEGALTRTVHADADNRRRFQSPSLRHAHSQLGYPLAAAAQGPSRYPFPLPRNHLGANHLQPQFGPMPPAMPPPMFPQQSFYRYPTPPVAQQPPSVFPPPWAGVHPLPVVPASTSPRAQADGVSTPPQEGFRRGHVAAPTTVAGAAAERNAVTPTTAAGAAAERNAATTEVTVAEPVVPSSIPSAPSDYGSDALPAALALSAMSRLARASPENDPCVQSTCIQATPENRTRDQSDPIRPQLLEVALRAVLIVDPTSTLQLTGNRGRRKALLEKVGAVVILACFLRRAAVFTSACGVQSAAVRCAGQRWRGGVPVWGGAH